MTPHCDILGRGRVYNTIFKRANENRIDAYLRNLREMLGIKIKMVSRKPVTLNLLSYSDRNGNKSITIASRHWFSFHINNCNDYSEIIYFLYILTNMAYLQACQIEVTLLS
jgi:hypothetical protein